METLVVREPTSRETAVGAAGMLDLYKTSQDTHVLPVARLSSERLLSRWTMGQNSVEGRQWAHSHAAPMKIDGENHPRRGTQLTHSTTRQGPQGPLMSPCGSALGLGVSTLGRGTGQVTESTGRTTHLLLVVSAVDQVKLTP